MTVGIWFTHREGLSIPVTKMFIVIWFSGGIQLKVILEFFSNLNDSRKGRNYLGRQRGKPSLWQSVHQCRPLSSWGRRSTCISEKNPSGTLCRSVTFFSPFLPLHSCLPCSRTSWSALWWLQLLLTRSLSSSACSALPWTRPGSPTAGTARQGCSSVGASWGGKLISQETGFRLI